MELLGDRNWWLPKWLEWLPRVNVEGKLDSLIEVGARNTYGHPTSTTLRELADARVPIERTDRDGVVRVDLARDGSTVATHTLP